MQLFVYWYRHPEVTCFNFRSDLINWHICVHGLSAKPKFTVRTIIAITQKQSMYNKTSVTFVQ